MCRGGGHRGRLVGWGGGAWGGLDDWRRGRRSDGALDLLRAWCCGLGAVCGGRGCGAVGESGGAAADGAVVAAVTVVAAVVGGGVAVLLCLLSTLGPSVLEPHLSTKRKY